jgi:hypothetical protein
MGQASAANEAADLPFPELNRLLGPPVPLADPRLRAAERNGIGTRNQPATLKDGRVTPVQLHSPVPDRDGRLAKPVRHCPSAPATSPGLRVSLHCGVRRQSPVATHGQNRRSQGPGHQRASPGALIDRASGIPSLRIRACQHPGAASPRISQDRQARPAANIRHNRASPKRPDPAASPADKVGGADLWNPSL